MRQRYSGKIFKNLLAALEKFCNGVFIVCAVFFLSFPARSSALGDAGIVFDLSHSSINKLAILCDKILETEDIKGSIILSWRQMDAFGENSLLAEKLKQLIVSGRLELLGGSYYDLSFLFSPDDILYSQTKRYKMLAESYTGVAADGFCPPNRVLRNSDLITLKNLGFKYCLLDEKFIEGENEERRLQPQITSDSIIIYPVSASVSEAASSPLSAGWLENFRQKLGLASGNISDSIPGGVLVFCVDMKAHTETSLQELFSAIKLLSIKTSTLKTLYSKQPPYFGEIQKIAPAPEAKMSLFQAVFLSQWKHLCSEDAALTAETKEKAYRMGEGRFYSEVPSPDTINEMVTLSSEIFEKKPSFTFEGPGGEILASANGMFIVYFLKSNITPLFIISQKDKKCIAGNPFITVPAPALKSYFNLHSFGGMWDVKMEEKEGSFRLSAFLKASPFEIKQTFVFAGGRDIIKFFLSVKNCGEKRAPCEISLEMSPSPSDSDSMFLSSVDGEFYGGFHNVSKEFNGIKSLAFPDGDNAVIVDFPSNYPSFLTSRQKSVEVVYGGKELSPGGLLLFEAHLMWKNFKVPENTHPLLEFSEIILDGAPNETLWREASHVIDPMRDGAEGCDISSLYFKSGKSSSYIYLEGQLENADSIYIVKTATSTSVLPGGVTVPNAGADYCLRLPIKTGAPSSYRWGGLWLATFEKGFVFSSGDKSLEMRLPWAFTQGEWAVYLAEKGSIKDGAVFTVK